MNGLFTAGLSTLATGEYLGIQPGFTDNTSVGGSSFVIHVAHAAAAIRAGYCDVALITHGQAGRSARAPIPVDPNQPPSQYEFPYGLIGPPVNYSMACARYMHDYGEDRTRQAMAEIAVATRKWANLNPQGGDVRDPDVLRRVPQLALGGLALPPARLLPGHRLRGRHHRHHRRAGPASCRKQPVWVLGGGGRPTTTT